MTNVHHRCVTTLDVGRPSSSSSGEKWASFKILFHGFADLPSAVDQYTLSPEFTCNGHKWRLRLFPGGDNLASRGYVSLYLQHCSGGYATATFQVDVLDRQRSRRTPVLTLKSEPRDGGISARSPTSWINHLTSLMTKAPWQSSLQCRKMRLLLSFQTIPWAV